MKRLSACLGAFLFFATGAFCQSSSEKVSGWNIGPLPCVSYNSDLGFQYGVCADVFYYGDGSLFPEYEHRFYLELSRYTKGQTIVHGQYDSRHLIPGVRMTASMTYQYDPLLAFYGFNGRVAYDKSMDLNPETKTALYSMKRSMFRGLLDFQGSITQHLNWVGGVSFWNFSVGDFSSDKYLPETSLFHQYVSSGKLLSNGGSHLEAKAGLVYDTRDGEAAPSKGIWAEAYLNGSPSIGGSLSYLKFVAHFRQYISLWSEKSVLAYHVGYQDTIAGETPYYMMPIIYTLFLRQTSSEGLGGYNTVRGLLQDRLVGEGYLWTNIEFRQRLFEFDFIGCHWYLAVNPFLDAGYISRTYKSEIFGEDDRFAMSAGAGLKLAMNENFILSFEAAQVLGHEEYPMGSSIVLNYIF